MSAGERGGGESKVRAAFIGFRHRHIFDVYALMSRRSDVEIVAAGEEDPETRALLSGEGAVVLTHAGFREMLQQVEFELLVVGDIFEKHGRLIIEGLEAGKHVLCDKPICIRLEELAAIEALTAAKALAVGAVLDLRDSGVFRKVRELVRAGQIGAVQAIVFGGQHPLLLDRRPGWYFTAGNHGGTINDIAIHAVDLIGWITGRSVREITAARCWNAGLPRFPAFQNAGQLMLVLEGGCGVIGDVSYLSPEGFGYGLPQYWRFSFWGEGGMIEAGLNDKRIRLFRSLDREVEIVKPSPSREGGYLENILSEIRGSATEAGNRALFAATSACLRAQEAADRGLNRIRF